MDSVMKEFEFGPNESLSVVVDSDVADTTIVTIFWHAGNHNRALMSWSGVSYRNPVDEPNSFLGKALATYRAITATNGDIAVSVLRDPMLSLYYTFGKHYADNGYNL